MITSIIVLAAGNSLRMGRPKPLLDFDGVLCADLVADACRDSRGAEIVVVLGAHAGEITSAGAFAAAGQAGLKIVINDLHERGRTSSIKVGLEAMAGRSDGFVLFPVDLPLVTAREIDALIERFEARPRGRTIFIPSHDGRRGHPVLFSSSHRSPILELGDDVPLHDHVRVREAEIEMVPVSNPGILSRMNTPEQYAEVLAAYRERMAGAAAPSGGRAS